MTPEDAAKLLPIIQAFSEGKEIEYCGSDGETWYSYLDYKFDSSPECYRIKNKHQKLIDAHKEGAKIQFLSYDGKTWLDVIGIPMWHEKVQYRVKRDIIQYRRYIFSVDGNNFIDCVQSSPYYCSSPYYRSPDEISSMKSFVRWIDYDWITEEV